MTRVQADHTDRLIIKHHARPDERGKVLSPAIIRDKHTLVHTQIRARDDLPGEATPIKLTIDRERDGVVEPAVAQADVRGPLELVLAIHTREGLGILGQQHDRARVEPQHIQRHLKREPQRVMHAPASHKQRAEPVEHTDLADPIPEIRNIRAHLPGGLGNQVRDLIDQRRLRQIMIMRMHDDRAQLLVRDDNRDLSRSFRDGRDHPGRITVRLGIKHIPLLVAEFDPHTPERTQ